MSPFDQAALASLSGGNGSFAVSKRTPEHLVPRQLVWWERKFHRRIELLHLPHEAAGVDIQVPRYLTSKLIHLPDEQAGVSGCGRQLES
ncbi:MAG: hypothetical protein R3C05_02325 [Pirellulaceae bacterium]